MKPLFMWAGGKTRMKKRYKPYLPDTVEKYHEPFFGGGAMFLWAYQQNPSASFYINDINKHIMGIYRAIKEDCDRFCTAMDKFQSIYLPLPGPLEEGGHTNKALQKKYQLDKGRRDWSSIYKEQPSRRHFYFKIRDRYAWDYELFDSTFEAAILYFLMKTGFNGVWQLNANTNGRFGTPCGLLNQKDKIYDKENVLKWHKALQGCTLTAGDFRDTLEDIDETSFVFLDPPYRGCFADYGTQSDDQFQEAVLRYHNTAAKRGALSMLCNRELDDGFFQERQGENKLFHFDVSYTVGRKKKLLDKDGKHAKDSEGNKLFQEAKKAKEILLINTKNT